MRPDVPSLTASERIRSEPLRTAERITTILFGPSGSATDHACHAWYEGHGRSAFSVQPGQLWVSHSLRRAIDTEFDSEFGHKIGHKIGRRTGTETTLAATRLLDPESLSGLNALAHKAAGTGQLIGVSGSDGSLLAAIAPDETALLHWQRAALSVGYAIKEPGKALLDRLLADGTVAVAATLPLSTRVAPPASIFATPCIAKLLLDHLALRLRTLEPSLIHPSSAIAASLARVDRTPADARLHLPPASAGHAPLPPDPMVDETGLRRWLMAPVGPGPYAPSRLLASVHANRIDLAEAYPDLTVEQWQIGLWGWAHSFGMDPDIGAGLPSWATRPPRPLPACAPPPTIVSRRGRAVQVVGYLEAALGLGEAARLAVRALELAGESVETTAYRHVVSPPAAFTHRVRAGQAPADIQLICLSGTALTRWTTTQIPSTGLRPYRIGLWFWESDTLSGSMEASLLHLDEVWVTSSYTAQAVSNAAPASMPVHVTPLGVAPAISSGSSPPPGSHAARRRVIEHCPMLGSTLDRGWCGFSFDLSSRLTRKNPLGLVAAWRDAFLEPGLQPGDPVLILKTVNGGAQPDALLTLQTAVADRADIFVVHEHWSATAHHNFIRALSLYASLHRSEGYGLVLLEAMAAGVPVLATGATGNMEFMDDSNAWLVPALPFALATDDGPYPKGSVMFSPDHATAVRLLATLLSSDPAAVHDRHLRTTTAAVQVASLADGSAAAKWMARRLAAIRTER